MSEQYPDGKLNPDDEGETEMAIGVERGCVVIRFTKGIHWIGLTPDGAVEFAQLLVRRAFQAGYDKPVTFTLGGKE